LVRYAPLGSAHRPRFTASHWSTRELWTKASVSRH